MSIVSEIERIIGAKTQLRNALEIRGVAVSENETIDSYAQKLKSCPYVVKGTFTPEEDTKILAVSNLSFTPEIIVFCCSELENVSLLNSIVNGYLQKGSTGLIRIRNGETTFQTMNIVAESATTTWEASGVTFSSPDVRDYVFKAGYSYEYVVIGGNER